MVFIQFAQAELGTKIEFFVTRANESYPLTVVTKNFILEAADVLDSASVKITV